MKLESGVMFPNNSNYLFSEDRSMSEAEIQELRRTRSGAIQTTYKAGVGGVAKSSGGILGAGYGSDI